MKLYDLTELSPREAMDIYPGPDIPVRGGCHCIECSQPMHYLSNCRLLVWSVNSLMALGWSIALMVAYVLFEFSLVGISMLALFSLLCFALSRIPRKSRAILREWKRWKEEQGLKELIDQSPGK